jgi:hypothetical protein
MGTSVTVKQSPVLIIENNQYINKENKWCINNKCNNHKKETTQKFCGECGSKIEIEETRTLFNKLYFNDLKENDSEDDFCELFPIQQEAEELQKILYIYDCDCYINNSSNVLYYSALFSDFPTKEESEEIIIEFKNNNEKFLNLLTLNSIAYDIKLKIVTTCG